MDIEETIPMLNTKLGLNSMNNRFSRIEMINHGTKTP